MSATSNMTSCLRTNSGNKDFQNLVVALDAELKILDGDDHAFYAQFNKTGNLKYVIVAYENEIAVGCGAIREYSPDTMEVKRMYVPVTHRKKGIASNVLAELEAWARELNCKKCVLETGKRQPEAIGLYTKAGYTIIPNFGQYKNMENSVCFEKVLAG